VSGLNRVWLTVDTDDLRHVPSHQGHPTRSKPDNDLPLLSDKFRSGMVGFKRWLNTHDRAVTMFIIADQCESEEFLHMIHDICESFGKRITIGCHGLNHRSWSAWPEDTEGFSRDLSTATTVLEQHFPRHFKRWFRAPAGYMASWMIPVLVEQGFKVDSSINPSWLVNKKYGNGESWKTVLSTAKQSSLVERPWKTRLSLPTCGPAQHITGLRWNARQAWRSLSKPLGASEVETIEDSSKEFDTIYWHILDHARQDGKWIPPIKGL
jgi:hypothetical protein